MISEDLINNNNNNIKKILSENQFRNIVLIWSLSVLRSKIVKNDLLKNAWVMCVPDCSVGVSSALQHARSSSFGFLIAGVLESIVTHHLELWSGKDFTICREKEKLDEKKEKMQYELR